MSFYRHYNSQLEYLQFIYEFEFDIVIIITVNKVLSM